MQMMPMTSSRKPQGPPNEEEPADFEDVAIRLSKLEAFVLKMQAHIQRKFCDLESAGACLGQSSPCPEGKARFAERLLTLESRIAWLKSMDLETRLAGLEAGNNPKNAIIQHNQESAILNWLSTTLCGMQSGCAQSSKATGGTLSTLVEEREEAERANVRRTPDFCGTPAEIVKEIELFHKQRQTDGGLAAAPAVPDSLVASEVRAFLSKTEELLAIVGPIGESMEQHFREMQEMQEHHFAEMRGAFDAKFNSATVLMSRQVEVLVDMKINDLRCHKEQMLVVPDCSPGGTIDSPRSQHTISSSLRDELAAVTAVSTAAVVAVAPAEAQETTVHDHLVRGYSAVDFVVPSKDDHAGLSSSYPMLPHRHRDFESSMSDSHCHVRLTSSYPTLPTVQSEPAGCPIQPPVWKPFSLSGRDDLHSVPEGPKGEQLLRDLLDARAKVPHSQHATIGITDSSQGRRRHWC